MIFWIIISVMALGVACLLAWTLIRKSAALADPADHELTLYRAQIGELQRELDNGRLTPAEAQDVRLEVERRMLSADSRRDDRRPRSGTERPKRIVAVAIATGLPAAAITLYAWLGSPHLSNTPRGTANPAQASDLLSAPTKLPDVATMTARLEQRLKTEPDDLSGWITLGQSKMALGRYRQAVDAYDSALRLRPDLAFLHAARGEALVYAAGGIVTPPARGAFARALDLDRGEMRARYYSAIALSQDGALAEALEALAALLEDAPADAPWAPAVRSHADKLARAAGLDPGLVLPSASRKSTGGSTRTASEPDRLAARLAQSPKDFRGWIELAELRAAAGNLDGARAALKSGAEAYPGAPFVQEQFRKAALALGLSEPSEAPRGPSPDDIREAAQMSAGERSAMIGQMVAGLAARLEEEPDDVEGWRMLARSYGVLGEYEKAVDAHRKVAELLPDDMAAQMGFVEASMNAIGTEAVPPVEVTETLEAILRADADNANALYYRGEIARRRNDNEGARFYWRRLLSQLPPGEREHAWLRQRIGSLPP